MPMRMSMSMSMPISMSMGNVSLSLDASSHSFGDVDVDIGIDTDIDGTHSWACTHFDESSNKRQAITKCAKLDSTCLSNVPQKRRALTC